MANVTIRLVELFLEDDDLTRTPLRVAARLTIPQADGTNRAIPLHADTAAGNAQRSIGVTESFDPGSAAQIEVRIALTANGAGVGQEIVYSLPRPFHRVSASAIRPAMADAAANPVFRIAWESISDLRPTSLPAAGPYAAARNLTTAVATNVAPNCWQYNPQYADSLVINKQEFDSPVPDLTNWQGWVPGSAQPFQSVFHAQRNHTNCRDPAAIHALVLHETDGDRFNDPKTPPRSWVEGDKLASHFLVHYDGSVTQFFDAVQRVSHAPPRNDLSVGIEFINIINRYAGARPSRADYTAANAIPNDARTPAQRQTVRQYTRHTVLNAARQFARGGRLFDTTDWWGSNAPKWVYIVPNLTSLESMYQLTKMLCASPLLAIPHNYLSLQHPHDNHLFCMSIWAAQYKVGPTLPGIYTHRNIGKHGDGSFQGLYCMLRHDKGLEPAAARLTAMELCGHWHSRAAADSPWKRHSGQWFLDVSGV